MQPRFRLAGLSILVLVNAVSAAERPYSPRSGPGNPTRVYFGDTHLHTNLSVDAYGMGNTNLGPDDAYRFARGESVVAHNGQQARMSRPLDFLVIADHAINLGVMPAVAAKDARLLATDLGQRWSRAMTDHPLETGDVLRNPSKPAFDDVMQSIFDVPGGGSRSYFWKGWTEADYVDDPVFRQSVWDRIAVTADRHNEPGTFTAFIGFEWTSRGQQKGNLHRVVIFRDDASKATSVLPFSSVDSLNPEDLWTYLESYERHTGGQVLAIPHNGNLSRGEMFSLAMFSGEPLSEEYARRRHRWEPLYEVTQIKGDGEAYPALSATDEFADFETWHSWRGSNVDDLEQDDWLDQKRGEYARSALLLGLEQAYKLGANPFKFGMAGGTDSHTSLASAEEDNFWGKFSLYEPSTHRLEPGTLPRMAKPWDYAAAGYTAIWAVENTREALFDAMRRRETYATTGPRFTVRFFGGWDFDPTDVWRSDFAERGYARGVPMGGDLPRGPEAAAPRFIVRAAKDPDGANLDRVQVIKGWRTRGGELREKVFDVALSDDRVIPAAGHPEPVGSTVDVPSATYVNSIGDPELAAVWTDPDFDPSEAAFWYVRVIAIPTPRWTAFDARNFGVQDVPDDVPMVVQERAYTSPIWYTPRARATARSQK